MSVVWPTQHGSHNVLVLVTCAVTVLVATEETVEKTVKVV
jgi:hypothetical protein